MVNAEGQFSENVSRFQAYARRRLLLSRLSLAALALGMLSCAAPTPAATAAEYPIKPIRLIVPFAPGGGTDIVARLLAQKLTEALAQPVVVDNRPGAAGNIGVGITLSAAPDGYTLIMVSTSYATNAALYKLAYDPIRDVTPIALIGETGFLVSAHPNVPAKNIKELIAVAKAKPLHYGSSGSGGIIHLATELFNIMAGTNMTHVPYKGSGAALNDLLGGHIQLIFSSTSVIPHVRSQRLRGIAVTTSKRLPALPEVETIAEAGVAGYEAVLWYGLLGPKGMQKHVVSRLNTEIRAVTRSTAVKEQLAVALLDVVDADPEFFDTVIKRDVSKWAKVVKTAGIRVE